MLAQRPRLLGPNACAGWPYQDVIEIELLRSPNSARYSLRPTAFRPSL